MGEASAAVAQKLYAEQAAEEGGDAPAEGSENHGDDVVDAEFEEVDGDDADADADADKDKDA